MYDWLVYLHIAGTFSFLLAHGASASVAFALRRERNSDHIRLLLDLSSSSLGILHGSIALLFISGIVAGFMGHWWNRGWIWLSLGLLLVMYFYMGLSVSGYYSKVRKAVGLPYMEGIKSRPAVEPAGAEEIDALLAKAAPLRLAVIGFAGLLLILWLMRFKPF